jgi:hypothetical protein
MELAQRLPTFSRVKAADEAQKAAVVQRQGRAMGASPARLTRAARSVARKGWLDQVTRESGAA